MRTVRCPRCGASSVFGPDTIAIHCLGPEGNRHPSPVRMELERETAEEPR